MIAMKQLMIYALGVISGCLLLSLSQYMFTLHQELSELRRVLLSDERMDRWKEKAMTLHRPDIPFENRKMHHKASPLDNKKDCNGQTYLSLKYKYKLYGGVTFKSCSLSEKVVDDVSTFTETVKGPIGHRDSRATNMWYHGNDNVLNLAIDKDSVEFIGYIHDRGAFPFQTLNFRVGTQQDTHADIVHFDTLPERGLMSAAWVALEDIHPDSGPLVWFPGSHKLGFWDYDELGMRIDSSSLELKFDEDYKTYERKVKETIDKLGLKPSYATLKKGESFIWSHSLLHGGSEVNNKELTRKSQVTHYYLTGATAYWQPRNSIPSLGKITYKCEVPTCTESDHTNCLERIHEAFKRRKIMHVDFSDNLPWVNEMCRIK